MQKKTFESRRLEYVSGLTQQNFADLYEILQWNLDHEMRFYCCISDLVPWNSQFELSELPDFDKIEALAQRCDGLIKKEGMQFTFHPDYWCKLASESPDTVERAVTAVEYHADWLDLMGLDRTPYYRINVHIGATYGDKDATADRFCETVERLSPGARKRLTVENDDKPNLWSVSELAEHSR